MQVGDVNEIFTKLVWMLLISVLGWLGNFISSISFETCGHRECYMRFVVFVAVKVWIVVIFWVMMLCSLEGGY